MPNYDNFAHTFSESRKNMKWEEIEYFLTKYAPFADVLDIGCGNGRLLGELMNYRTHLTSPWKWEESTKDIIPNLIGNPENHVGEKKQCISDSSFHSEWQGTFSSYLWIDASERLLEEAEKLYKNKENVSVDWKLKTKTFQHLDMRSVFSLPENSFDSIFFIASFHHLEKFEERLQVLQDVWNILKNWGKIFLTNWALESDFNREKYASSKVLWSENEFHSNDFQIKIWEFLRYYHSFALEEIEFISSKAWFQIIENRLFETGKNFITILKKK